MPTRRVNSQTYDEFAIVAAEPIPVNIGNATLSVTAEGVEIKNDAGNPIPTAPNVQQGGGATTANTLRVTLATDGPGVANLSSIAGLAIPAHDHIALSYTGSNLTGVTYRTGGSGGTIVGTLTLAYSGSNLISVAKS